MQFFDDTKELHIFNGPGIVIKVITQGKIRMFHTRLLEEKIKQTWTQTKVLLLVGPRQVGKSTLLKHMFPSYRNIVFDPTQDLYNVKEDPDLFLRSFPSPLILDEIQYCPSLLSSIKRKVDETDREQQYVLTGSQNFSMLRQVAESMAGRVIILDLHPFTFLEKYQISLPLWVESYLAGDDLLKSLEISTLPHDIYHIMWQGGMPGLISKTDDFYASYFDSYLQTYLERDIRLLSDIKNVSDFSKFIRLLALLSAQEVNYAQLGREIGVANSTALAWKEALNASFVYQELPPYFGNALKRLAKKPKGYFFDTGFLCYLHMIPSPQALAQHPKNGSVFENYIVTQLQSYLSAKIQNVSCYHWRTSTQQEVDLVIEYNGRLHPIEIKLKSHVSKKDAQGIEVFFKTYGSSSAKGIILYAGQTCHYVTENIIAVPWNSVTR